jgi:hypothetical protein
MRVYGYGEDVLTLCALQRNFVDLLNCLDDKSYPAGCEVFYRPRFGRATGDDQPEFGQFNFIILSRQCLYLGETKWDKRLEAIRDGVIAVEPEEKRRHEIFKFYLDHWAFGSYRDWAEFREQAQPLISKRLPAAETRLASNLRTVLAVIKEHFGSPPTVKDVLLYFHHGAATGGLPQRAGDGFELVCVDCSGSVRGNFIKVEM